jgi:hypothetical protein
MFCKGSRSGVAAHAARSATRIWDIGIQFYQAVRAQSNRSFYRGISSWRKMLIFCCSVCLFCFGLLQHDARTFNGLHQLLTFIA